MNELIKYEIILFELIVFLNITHIINVGIICEWVVFKQKQREKQIGIISNLAATVKREFITEIMYYSIILIGYEGVINDIYINQLLIL